MEEGKEIEVGENSRRELMGKEFNILRRVERRCAVLSRKDAFAPNELLQILLHRFFESVRDFLAICHGV